MMKKGQIVAHGTPTQIKAELVREYVLIDAEDWTALRTELTHLQFPFVETPQFRLPFKAAAIHATLKAIETPLTSVHPDAYTDA